MWLAWVTVFIISILASIGGIGGGGLILPIYLLLGQQTVKNAVVLTIATIAGNTLLRVLCLYGLAQSGLAGARTRERPLIDYYRLSQIVLFDAASSAYGVYLQQILPDQVILGLVVAVLSLVLIITVAKTYQIWQQQAEEPSLHLVRNYEQAVAYLPMLVLFLVLIVAAATIAPLDSDKTPWWHLPLVFSLINIVVGGLVVYRISHHRSWKQLLTLPVIALQAGWISSLLGIGGGMLINPVLLLLEVPADQVVATASLTTFYSALTSLLQYSSRPAGLGNTIQSIIVSMVVGLLGSLVGLATTYGFQVRRPIVTTILAVLIAVSLVAIVGGMLGAPP